MKIDDIKIGYVYTFEYPKEIIKYVMILQECKFIFKECWLVVNENGLKYRISKKTKLKYIGKDFPEHIKQKQIKKGEIWKIGEYERTEE